MRTSRVASPRRDKSGTTARASPHAPEHLRRALPHAGRFVVEPPGQRHRRALAQRRRQLANRDHRRLAHLVLAVAERALERLHRAHRVLGRLVRARPLQHAPIASAAAARRCASGSPSAVTSCGTASTTRWRPIDAAACARTSESASPMRDAAAAAWPRRRPRVELVDGIAPPPRVRRLQLFFDGIDIGEEIARLRRGR